MTMKSSSMKSLATQYQLSKWEPTFHLGLRCFDENGQKKYQGLLHVTCLTLWRGLANFQATIMTLPYKGTRSSCLLFNMIRNTWTGVHRQLTNIRLVFATCMLYAMLLMIHGYVLPVTGDNWPMHGLWLVWSPKRVVA